MQQPVPIAKPSRELALLPELASHHGLITGATGKTVTLPAAPQPLATPTAGGSALDNVLDGGSRR